MLLTMKEKYEYLLIECKKLDDRIEAAEHEEAFALSRLYAHKGKEGFFDKWMYEGARTRLLELCEEQIATSLKAIAFYRALIQMEQLSDLAKDQDRYWRSYESTSLLKDLNIFDTFI